MYTTYSYPELAKTINTWIGMADASSLSEVLAVLEDDPEETTSDAVKAAGEIGESEPKWDRSTDPPIIWISNTVTGLVA